MADATAERSGMMAWVSAIRMSMANDPGRQILDDQIQSGFLFLEDYLDNILAGPRHDPLIELLKTPGRKRDVPKKMKAATVQKPKAIVNIDTDDEEGFDKENEAPPTAPVNSFHKALLQSKAADSNTIGLPQSNQGLRVRDANSQSARPPSAKKPTSKAKFKAISNKAPTLGELEKKAKVVEREEEEEVVVEKLITPPRTDNPLVDDDQRMDSLRSISPTPQAADLVVPAHEDHNNLSVIAEVDEAFDHSKMRVSNGRRPSATPEIRMNKLAELKEPTQSKPINKLPYNIDLMTVLDLDDFTQTTAFTSTQSFHTIPLDTPVSEKQPVLEDKTSDPRKSDRKDPIPQTQGHEDESDSHSAGPAESNASTLPAADHTTTLVPLREESDQRVHERRSNEDIFSRSTTNHFPTIGAPSPLRKSMRAPKEPFQPAHATLPSKQNTTRSSWLVKAREAKAMEDNAKHAIIAAPTQSVFSTQPTVSLKRKSGEMLGIEIPESDTGRTQKLTKVAETSPLLSMLKDQNKFPFNKPRQPDQVIQDMVRQLPESSSTQIFEQSDDVSEGMIDKLKKTVAGFSHRNGKSMGKSLGGAAADALAARLAAEAKIAERHAAEWGGVPGAASPSTSAEATQPTGADAKISSPAPSQPTVELAPTAEPANSRELDRRLSVSDLVSKYEPKKDALRERVFQPPPKDVPITKAADTSTSTTPPHSPPTKRAPVFTVPEKPKVPPSQVFFPPSAPTAFSRRDESLGTHSHTPQPISAQSSQSTYPDTLFDHEHPTWTPSTQDTEIIDQQASQPPGLQTSKLEFTEPQADMDADESWHLDDKYDDAWSPVVMKDDSMTWSTAPTRSTRAGDTDRMNVSASQPEVPARAPQEDVDKAAAEPPAPVPRGSLEEDDMDVEEGQDLGAIRLVTPAKPTFFSSNKESHATSSGGFFSSATKLVTSVLGGSKKGKEPVKSLQMAAAAAKKQQEEADKKVSRLKEMEMRRQQALQKKVDVEKAREEKKAKEEEERYRREREKDDTTEKRALRQPGKKLAQIEEDMAKKRKLAETDKKADPKKPLSKDKQDPPKVPKPFPVPQSALQTSSGPPKSLKQPTVAFSQTATSKATVQIAELATANIPNKTKAAKGKDVDMEERRPQQTVQAQMQARVQAELEQTKKAEVIVPAVPSEAIELPDINSEYSDSDDEDRKRTFDPPHWAQSPALKEALQQQSTVDPDDIFGAIKPLKMEELFRTRTSRFRARTSSACWAGADELTAAEEKEYARRMGFKK